MTKGYLDVKYARCGTYRGIDIFEVNMAGKFVFLIQLGMSSVTAEKLDPLKEKIDEWWRLKIN